MEATLYSDGGSRGNPGPSGSGAVLFSSDGEVLGEAKRYLGHTTNNVAEYTAIIIGLDMALELGVTHVLARMDSELAVKQLNGQYRVKNQDLAKLFLQVKERAAQFTKVTFEHVRRERNKHADGLVNNVIDEALA